MRVNEVKRFFVLVGSMTVVSFLGSTPAAAQNDEYLKQIAENTYNTLQKVNDLPTYLQSLNAFITAWMSQDDSAPTVAMQGSFTNLGNMLITDQSAQLLLQPALNAYLLNNDGNNVFSVNNGTATPTNLATSSTLWYANDLVYSSLLGVPYFAKDPRQQQQAGTTNKIDFALNYVRNASGMNIYHMLPGSNWQGKKESQARYQSYFNTVTSAESFGAYILSKQYLEKDQFTTLQAQLIKQASDPKDWFAQVSSESIGFVLRQLLLYQSQIFVLLTQMLQTQNQMVTAQVMTNAVLIANNSLNETMLVSNAQGKQPTP
ncbi:hypothetical protein AQUSIP_03720 [Aquicella siphonis]|uniref:Imelysin-like domain-containing protein n=1 Tax=Aquicella siphonis TaxID=254247 RepID=A0A5E4PFJ2_9COXI|nr:hypothetical protein [Aquicella siphonis]VVC75096.1 hypothetical protein AQUSIP_03720 [Aquicella siphonis]